MIAPQLDFVIGNIYIFDQSDSSNVGHQIQITELRQNVQLIILLLQAVPGGGRRDSKVTVTIQQI